MKFSVTQKHLIEAVTTVSHIVNARNPLEILSTLLITADKNNITFQANNLEMAAEYSIPASVGTSGSICVPARLLVDVVTNIKADKIEISTTNETLTLSAKGFQSEIAGLSAADFPAIPQLSDTHLFSLPSEQLRHVLSRVLVSVGIDDARPVLSGIYFAIQKDQVILAATDSYRLSEQVLKLTNKEEIAVIVPAATFQEILRLTNNKEAETIDFEVSESALKVKVDNTLLVAQLINGKYPDYTKIIPSENTTEVEVDRELLLQAVRATALFSREGSLGITLTLKGSTLQLQAQTATIGSGTSEVTLTTKVAKEAHIVLNAKYLLDALNCLDTKTITLGLSGELEPFVLRPSDKKDQFIHIIMPLRG